MCTDAYLIKQLRTALMHKDKELASLQEKIANTLDDAAVEAMKSNEYNFNDTAVRAKTFMLAADIVRGNDGL